MRQLLFIILILLAVGCGDEKKELPVNQVLTAIPEPDRVGEAELPPMPPVLE